MGEEMINDTASFCIHGGLIKFGCNLCSQDKEIFERLERIEKEIDEINNGLIKRIGILGEALQGMSDENARLKYKPHKCPVCDGKEKYYHKFDGQSVPTLITCIACEGKGIIWV